MAKERNLIVAFEGLTKEQFTLVDGLIEAIGQHTLQGGYMACPDATDADVALIFGLAIETGRIQPDRFDPESSDAAGAWALARERLFSLRASRKATA